MNELLNRIFGLGEFGFGAEGAELGFRIELGLWVWALILVAAGLLGWYSYWRLPARPRSRAVLACLRVLTVMLVALVIAGPLLTRQQSRVERDAVLVLVDRSRSLAVPDAPAGATRERQLEAALEASSAAWDALDADKDVLWFGFDAGAIEIGRASEAASGEPDGRRTALGTALDQALKRLAARPLSGVVIISDGRSIDEPSRAALRRLQAEQVPVFVAPLGSSQPIADLGVRRVEAPRLAFLDDRVPVRVELDRLGGGRPGETPGALPGGAVELVDRGTGLVLDRVPLDRAEPDAGGLGVTLTTTPTEAGARDWVVRLDLDDADLIADNNQASVSIDLVDRPLRVLYFDGYPRWEQRYVKDLLLREDSISSSSLMLAADRRYLQEGDVAIDRLPVSPEEWAEYDVVIIGDMRSDLFGAEQLAQLRDHVAERGAGLLWIAGPGATPASWAGTPLADLLPITTGSDSTQAGLPEWDEPIVVHRAPAAERLGVLMLADADVRAWPPRLSDPATGWSQIRWAQRIVDARMKPTTEVFALGVPISASRSDPSAARSRGSPLVLSMRYGAGRVIYVATDETWRWRYGRGEDLPERFWLPLVRLLGRESLSRSGQAAVLTAAPKRASVEQPVTIRLDLLDQSLADARPDAVTVTVTRDDGVPVELRLGAERVGDGGRGAGLPSYTALWIPGEPGAHVVRVTEPLLATLGLSTTFEVAWPDDESRHPETDHPLLERLAADTGGAVVEPASLSEIPGRLPNRALVIAGAPEIATLWDRPVVLALLIGLLTLEWVGRKLLKLA